MHISFEVAGKPAEFQWKWINGRATLTVDGESTQLQSPWNPRSSFSFNTTRSWQRDVDGHHIEIVKVRPWAFAVFRPSDYTVKVDGSVVVEKSGM